MWITKESVDEQMECWPEQAGKQASHWKWEAIPTLK